MVLRLAIIMLCWFLMASGCMIDFWSGINTAKALGEKRNSKGFRRTITKIGDYFRVLMFTFLFDVIGFFFIFYKMPFATILCTVAILLIEGGSVLENSKRKKSHAGDIPEAAAQVITIAKKIVETKDVNEAINLINKIKNETRHDNNTL